MIFIKTFNIPIIDQQHLGIVGSAVILVTAYKLYQRCITDKELQEVDCPVVPYTNIVAGSTEEYKQDPQPFIEKYTAMFGPVFRVHIFGRLQTVVSGSYVREIFFNENFSFTAGISRRFNLRLLAGMTKDDIPDDGLRTIIVKYLTMGTKKYTPRAIHHMKIGLNELFQDLAEPQELPSLLPIVQHMVAKASASVFVGLKLVEDKEVIDVFKHIVIDISRTARVNNVWLDYFTTISNLRMWYSGKFRPPMRERKNKLRNALIPVIDERLREIKRNDLSWERPDDILQEMLENYPPPASYEADMYTYYTHWVIGLIFASVHTTSEHTTLVLYRLLQHPKIIDELLEEQKQVYGDEFYNDKSITADSLKKLVKLDSVCRETLRLKNDFLSLPHANTSNKNIMLSNGVIIPPGHEVLLNFWANHRDTDLQKDSHGDHSRFDPFRHLDTGRPASKIGDDYLVFGEGKHACPGRWFALQEIKTIVTLLIRNYKLKANGPIEFPLINARIPMNAKVTIQKRM